MDFSWSKDSNTVCNRNSCTFPAINPFLICYFYIKPSFCAPLMCRKRIYAYANRLGTGQLQSNSAAGLKSNPFPLMQPYHSPSKSSKSSRFIAADDIYNLFWENWATFKGLNQDWYFLRENWFSNDNENNLGKN